MVTSRPNPPNALKLANIFQAISRATAGATIKLEIGSILMKKITLKKRALETLRHSNIGQINFHYGSLHVYPDHFRRIADLIDNDHIVYRPDDLGNNYDPTPVRGQQHYIGVHYTLGREEHGELIAASSFTPQNRGTIVHEACHAVHDYQRVSARHGGSILPRQFEGAATLAGWIATLLWGYDRAPNPFLTPAMVLARDVARQLISGTIGNEINPDKIGQLDEAVHIGSASRYVFNGT